MTALPFSIFRLVQGLMYPHKANICIYGPWDTRDFSTTHFIQMEVTTETDLVVAISTHENIQTLLDCVNHVDFKFNLIIASKVQQEIVSLIGEHDYTFFETREACLGLIQNKFAKPSYIRRCIEHGIEIDLDDRLSFLPNLDLSKWTQQNNEIRFDSPEGLVTFRVPNDFSLARTSPDLLWTIEILLLSPWYEIYDSEWIPTRRPGRLPGLSFSGGIDSTAALCLMPENTILLYLERNFESMIKHDNALHFLNELKKDGWTALSIKSNHEFIRANHNKNPGFSTDYACMAHLILLADYFDLDAAGTGMPLENSYFYHGSVLRDFSETYFWKSYSVMFNYLGLPLYQPVAGCSEVLNNEIVKKSKFQKLAKSCLRSDIVGETCERCWKCFRKNIFNQKSWEMSREISTFLSKRPLKQGVATLFALQSILKTEGSVPKEAEDLIPILNHDLSFLQQFWEPSLALLPEKYHVYTTNKINQFAKPMHEDLFEFSRQVLSQLRGEVP